MVSVDDKTGQALSAQRFQMLADIAKELAGDVTFPTCFEVAVRLRRILNDSDQSIQQIQAAVSVDPLICSKLLRLANSVAYNPMGSPVRDVGSAILRLGVNTVRSAAMAVAMKQLLLSKDMVPFSDTMDGLWEHSIRTASACCVLARRFSRISPDEALLAGLVHDLGAFYMLYRASQYEELRTRPDTVKYLIAQWHESIGDTLLNALGLPEGIVEAIRDHDQPHQVPAVPRNLADIVYVGNVLAGGNFEWLYQDGAAADRDRSGLDGTYLAMREEIDRHVEEMRAALN